MAYEHKPGSFTLFRKEKTKETQPDYSGTGKDLQGNEIEVAGWLKESAKGKFLSCVFKQKQARNE